MIDYKPWYSKALFIKKNPNNHTLDKYWAKTINDALFRHPSPKAKLYNNVPNDKVHHIHEADVMYLPEDQGFKYVLTLIDTASRFKIALPLKGDRPTGDNVLELLKLIYSRFPKPDILMTDGGSEFANKAIDRILAINQIHHVIKPTGHHLAFIEAFNGQLAKALFLDQHNSEFKTKQTSRHWVDNLPDVVNAMNHIETRGIRMAPMKAVQQKIVQQYTQTKFDDSLTSMHWPIGTNVRRLLEHDELLDLSSGKIRSDKRRITDPLWSLKIYRVVGYILDLEEAKKQHRLVMHVIREVDLNGQLTSANYKDVYTYWQLREAIS